MIKSKTKNEVKELFSELLNECLETMNQERTFEVKKVDLVNMKFIVEFDIVEVEEDNYIGFGSY